VEENRMSKTSLTALAHEQLDLARDASSGRSAHTVSGGHENPLRQTVIALLAGQYLHDHDSGGEATLQVLEGHVRLVAGADSWDGASGDLIAVPDRTHRVEAVEDSVVLLTVALQVRT
jgi:quercetin dioxygenase-like cupin family protein